MASSLSGRLLVATPELGDPNFERAVVYLVDHDADGALGVVLNRPSTTDVSEHFGPLRSLAAPPPVLFAGGPVSQASVVVLGRAGEGAVELVDLAAVVEGATPSVSELRMFVGYAGWGPGQLDGEVATGSWFVLGAVPDDVFCAEPAGLWRSVLGRQDGPLNRLARYPDDLSAN